MSRNKNESTANKKWWQPIALWWRWYSRHRSGFPSDDANKNAELHEKVVKPRLGSIVLKIRASQRRATNINQDRENQEDKLREYPNDSYLKALAQRLNKNFEKQRGQTEKALTEYRTLWKLYKDTNALDPAWGDSEQFLKSFQPYVVVKYSKKNPDHAFLNF